MEKYPALTTLFVDLSFGGPTSIPAELLNQEFPVWSIRSNGLEGAEVVNAHVSGQKLLESLREQGYTPITYGIFRDPSIDWPEGIITPSTEILVIGPSKPSGDRVFLVDRTLTEIMLYCQKHSLGIGVVSTEVGINLATYGFLTNALLAVRDLVNDETKASFLGQGKKVSLPENARNKIEEFVTTFSSYLHSIDYATLDVDSAFKLTFYLNFKDDVDREDWDLVQDQFVELLESTYLMCHVLCSDHQPELSNELITRVVPEPFEVGLSRIFGPNSE